MRCGQTKDVVQYLSGFPIYNEPIDFNHYRKGSYGSYLITYDVSIIRITKSEIHIRQQEHPTLGHALCT